MQLERSCYRFARSMGMAAIVLTLFATIADVPGAMLVVDRRQPDRHRLSDPRFARLAAFFINTNAKRAKPKNRRQSMGGGFAIES